MSNDKHLCETHPHVDYKTAWGCPECVREMRDELTFLRSQLADKEKSASRREPMMGDQGLELTDEERALVAHWRDTEPGWMTSLAVNVAFVATILKLQARGDRAEFQIAHDDCWITADDKWSCNSSFDDLGNYDEAKVDPRHTWESAQWIEAAKQALADTEEK